MSEMQAMMARWTVPGVVEWIGLRPGRRTDMAVCERVEVGADGLQGDRARAGKRAVTLIQAEHLRAIGSYLGGGAVDPAVLRRNVVVRGLNLASLKGRNVRIGQAVLHITTICAPCSRMEEVFGPGGYAAVRGHGGWCAHVVSPGAVAIGDVVRPVD